jgi:hypothetical protein
MDRQTQLIVFLKNAPGELSKMCEVLRLESINILAMSIQNAEDYLRGLFKAREITGRRIAPAANYGSVIKDSEDYSVIRFIVERQQTQDALTRLRDAGYTIESSEVLMVVLDNRPGMLGAMAGTFARAGINIDYVYGSALSGTDKALFVVHVDESVLHRAAGLFPLQETE